MENLEKEAWMTGPHNAALPQRNREEKDIYLFPGNNFSNSASSFSPRYGNFIEGMGQNKASEFDIGSPYKQTPLFSSIFPTKQLRHSIPTSEAQSEPKEGSGLTEPSDLAPNSISDRLEEIKSQGKSFED